LVYKLFNHIPYWSSGKAGEKCSRWVRGQIINEVWTNSGCLLIPSYSKRSLTLKEWGFNLSFSWMSMLFLNSWRVSSHIVRYDTSPPAIQKQHWHSREAQIEPPLIECKWALVYLGLLHASSGSNVTNHWKTLIGSVLSNICICTIMQLFRYNFSSNLVWRNFL
jgi:hypothetical protein